MLQETIRTSTIDVMEETYAMIRLAPNAALPGECFAAMWDEFETTAVVAENDAGRFQPQQVHGGLRLLRVNVSAPFAAPGFLAAICAALAARGINVLVVSTFSRDYVLVDSGDLAGSLDALRGARFPVNHAGASG